MLQTTKSEWNSYPCYTFVCEDHEGIIILPHTPLKPGNRWIWRTEFLGAFDSVDRELLNRGWCLTNFRISDMYGCPKAVEWMESFRQLVVKEWNLSEKPVLEGFSRGGLYAGNFAVAHPDKTGGLYLDAAVLDIRNWPGGYGTYARWDEAWEECLRWYGLTEETAPLYDNSPLNHAEMLAKAGIPTVIVAGLVDKAVYYPENGGAFAEAYEKVGGRILTILKPDCDHHPHSLEDPTEICDFLEEVTL